MTFEDFLNQRSIKFETFEENIYKFNNQFYLLVKDKDIILDDGGFIVLFPSERRVFDKYQCKLVFKFGETFYYSDNEKFQLGEIGYPGESVQNLNIPFPYLGLHCNTEVGNALPSVKKYIQKAKFLGYKTLGICEKNTLAGAFHFYDACNSAKIKPIIGYTLTVEKNEIKLYVKNETGWRNSLKLLKVISVDHDVVTFDTLKTFSEGLVCVVGKKNSLTMINAFDKIFEECYYQLDPTTYIEKESDETFLNPQNEYLKSNHHVRPVLISDTLYLEKEHYPIKDRLALVLKNIQEHKTDDQYFKGFGELYEQFIDLFQDQEKAFNLFQECISNLKQIESVCNFEFNRNPKLPKYIMEEEDYEIASNTNDLFYNLIQKGLQEKVVEKGLEVDKYISRLEEELPVIVEAGFIDYFLTTALDVIRVYVKAGYPKSFGRGSSGGCLVAYFLGIVEVDPIHYKLPFSRFLNEGRLWREVNGKKMVVSLPDIDSDMSSDAKQLVVKHLQNKYGFDNVCYIGAYSQFGIESGLQDFAKLEGVLPQDINKFSAMLPKKQVAKLKDKKDLILYSQKKPAVKQFIQSFSPLIDDLSILEGAFRQTTVHASGIIIVPKIDEEGNETTLYDYFPIKKGIDKKTGNEILVSEFDKKALESLAFLKQDLLVITALDKMARAVRLISDMYNEVIDTLKVPDNDEGVYREFSFGNSDQCFQFSGHGMQSLLKNMRPTSIEHLAAANALYRPGPMSSQAHIKYCLIRQGKAQEEYDHGTESVLKDTYSQYVYQEQIMKICEVMAGFSPSKADDVRSAMGKKQMDKLKELGKDFIEGATKNGYGYAEEVWKKMEGFGEYAFNKSHAVMYSRLGYVDQWLKVNYPLAFWASALEHEKKDGIMETVWAIQREGKVKVLPSDINKSNDKFTLNKEKNIIYFSLDSINGIADKAVETINRIKEEYGRLSSFEEFLYRSEQVEQKRKAETKERGDRYNRSINRTVIVNLILCGAFDDIENIDKPIERLRLLKEYESHGGDIKDLLDIKSNYEIMLRQLELSKIGYIDFTEVFPGKRFQEALREEDENTTVAVAGIIHSFELKKTRQSYILLLNIQTNQSIITVFAWDKEQDLYKKVKDQKMKPCLVEGKVALDTYSETYRLNLEDKPKITIK